MAEAPKALKDAALQAYYDNLFAMHGSAGWAELMTDVEYMLTEHNKVNTVKDAEELYFRQGQLEMLGWLKTHKDRTEAAYAHILEEESGQESEPTGGIAKVVA